jgi:hypothetical protein
MHLDIGPVIDDLLSRGQRLKDAMERSQQELNDSIGEVIFLAPS